MLRPIRGVAWAGAAIDRLCAAVALLSAPRSLKDAVNWKFSNFRTMSQPAICDRVWEYRTGVRSTAPFMASAAAPMSRMAIGRLSE